ncbi:MAG: methyltransferase [Myxococcota bacterium]
MPHRLLLDPHVLSEQPLCEFQHWHGVARCGGVAILPWRRSWLDATVADINARNSSDGLSQQWTQCVVHLQKSRDATWSDLAEAWRLLTPGGRLLFCGGNALGVVSAVKRLAKELQQEPQILAHRARARVACFVKGVGPTPVLPQFKKIGVPLCSDARLTLATAPGVFSASKLDRGTALLLSCIENQPPPEAILDLGCGAGPLGIVALHNWPHSRALLLDADARAVACAQHNAQRLGVGGRCQVQWWDATEGFAPQYFDLILLNPPFHTGKSVDLSPAQAMFNIIPERLRTHGTALVVANRSLPYEKPLARVGEIKELRVADGYKVIQVTHPRRR